MSNQQPILEARAVGRRLPQADGWLLRDIGLQVRAGDRTAIVGQTGSGKTLLLRALALLDPLDSGEILWQGNRVASHEVPAVRSKAIYLHQRPALIEDSVEENLRAPFTLRIHRDRHFEHQQIVTCLNWLGRDSSFLAKHQRDLSGGEAQIVALLRAIQLAPEILLLDEPTAALDQQAVEAVERLVNRWLQDRPDRRAAVWVTHDRNQAQRVADQVLQMAAGRIQREP